MITYYSNYVEKKISYIKCLRTDRKGEFNSLKFNKFCKEHEIKRQLTVVYIPQQNRVVETKNRTMMNMVRCILLEKKIPKTFWPEVVNSATHILNRSSTLAVKDVMPEEAWSGCKPLVAHFRVFECIAHVHVPNLKRTKVENKSYTCAFGSK